MFIIDNFLNNSIYYLIFFITGLGIISSMMVLLATNPVHSILYLILVFITVISYFFFIGVEFLALTFLIVYVGAIAVLFLFIVMMLNIRVIQLKENFTRYLPIGFFVLILFFLEIFWILDMVYMLKFNQNLVIHNQDVFSNWIGDLSSSSKTSLDLIMINQLLYIYNWLDLILCSLILLVAMIGSICLTLNYTVIIKRQDIYDQIEKSITRSIILK